MWRVMATTGMRKGEVLGLTWRCADLDGHSLRVEQQVIAVRGGLRFGPPKTRRSERTIALDAGTVQALREHRETQQLERAVAGPVYCDQDLVFANEIGQPISPHRVTEWFKRHRTPPASPPARRIRCGTRWRPPPSLTASRSTSWLPGSGMILGPRSAYTATCCRAAIRRRRIRSRGFSLTNR
jgi:integrase